MRRLVCGWLIALVSATAAASGADMALLAPSVFVSQDSEDFSVRKIGAGVAPVYAHGLDHTLVKAAQHRYATKDWSAEGTHVSVSRAAVNARTGLGYQASLGLGEQGGHQLLVADVDYARGLGGDIQGGLFLSRDWVETRAALSQGISSTHYGGSVEQRLAPGWVVIGLLGQQLFSDNNIRNHARVRLVHDLLPDLGLNVQYRHRHFWNSLPYGGNYFSPDVYSEDMLALGWRRRLEGWTWAGTLGLGQQKVAGDPQTATHLAELEVSSPLVAGVHFRGRFGYSDSAGIGGPDYAYRYLQADLIFRF